MARLKQAYLPIKWDAIEECPDLQRVEMVLKHLPDEPLMKALERRATGRPDATSVRVKWNCLLMARLLDHPSMQSLLRELKRNPTLRRFVGINPALGVRGVPDKHEMSRFALKLANRHAAQIEALQGAAVEQLRKYLPDLGEQLGTDTTAIRTWARGKKKPSESADPEADWGYKIRRWFDKKGKMHESVTKWFGYKAHLLVDTRHELPLARSLTKASRPDNEKVLAMVEDMKAHHRDMSPKTLSGDKAYDSGPLIKSLWKRHNLRAVFDLRDTAQDGEDGEALEGARNILLGDDGYVYCYTSQRGKTVRQAMAPWGFEKDRGTLKYRCPAAVMGTRCPEREQCGTSEYGRIVRVKNHADWRRFGPMARGTKQWKRLYKGRTAVERINGRLKRGLGLGDLTVRGQANIGLQLDLGILVIYGLSLGHLKRGARQWRSYTRVAD